MKVLHVWVFYNEALKYHVHYLAAEQARRGHDVSILCGATVKPQWASYSAESSPRAGRSHFDGYQLVRLPVHGLVSKPVSSPTAIRDAIYEEQPDIVHVFGLSQLFSVQVLEVLRSRFPNVPVVANDHSNPTRVAPGLIGSLFYSFWSRWNRRYEKQIKSVVVPNRGSESLIKDRYPYLGARTQVVPLGYDRMVFNPQAGARNHEDRLVVGFAGKIDPAKRVDRLIEAVHEGGLADSVRCIIAGGQTAAPEYVAELKSRAEDLGVDVEWRPFLSPSELASLYATVDVACFPGSISITTLEATGAGAPVLVWRSIPGLEDRVSGGRGALFDEDAELVSRLTEYADLKRGAGIDHNAIAEASQELSWQSLTNQYEEIYDLALS